MAEKPILFSGPMVTAIREGRKTQTRRVIVFDREGPDLHMHGIVHSAADRDEYGYGRWSFYSDDGESVAMMRPKCRPGDRLWVRERWRLWQSESFGIANGEPLDPDVLTGSLAAYSQDWLRSRPVEYHADTGDEGPWRPSIHMPRWASRLTLEVTEVRAQRLQDISEADAAAEGIEFEYPDLDEPATAGGEWFRPGRHGFKNLWDSLNEQRDYGWRRNPWVWAITFRPLSSGNS